MGMVHPVMNGEKRKEKDKAYLEIMLSELEQGPIRIERDIPVEWLLKRMSSCEYSAAPKSAKARLEVLPSGGGFLIRGEVAAQIESRCGTCLKDITIEMAPDISAYLVPKADAMKEFEDYELTPEDLDREYFDGDTIVLDEIIGDAIMLEMPMNPKCIGECEGLAEFSGTSDVSGIDPRLAPLMGIKIKKEK